MEDKRAHQRMTYRGYATLVDAKASKHVCHLINLSRGGALVALLIEHDFNEADSITLQIELGGEESAEMRGQVVHQQENYIGLACSAISHEDEHKLATLLTDSSH